MHGNHYPGKYRIDSTYAYALINTVIGNDINCTAILPWIKILTAAEAVSKSTHGQYTCFSKDGEKGIKIKLAQMLTFEIRHAKFTHRAEHCNSLALFKAIVAQNFNQFYEILITIDLDHSL